MKVLYGKYTIAKHTGTGILKGHWHEKYGNLGVWSFLQNVLSTIKQFPW